MLEELLLTSRLADLERDCDAAWTRAQVLQDARRPSARRPSAERTTMNQPVDDATALSPWGGPGHGFINRRRAWLRDLLAAARSSGSSARHAPSAHQLRAP